MKTSVLTKEDFVRRYKQGEFGNASRTWNNVKDWMEATHCDPDAKYHLRCRKIGGPTFYNLSERELFLTAANTVGGDSENYYISEMAPHHLGTIQGEVQRQAKGLYLRYNFVQKPMRDAFEEQELHCWNLQALHLIRCYMNQKSQDWLEHLLDTYEGHTVEFSCFSKEWGSVPGYNTVFWEVRNY